MTKTLALAVTGVALVLTAACGGKTDDPNNNSGGSGGNGATGATGATGGGGSGGASGGSGGATGGSGGMPVECSVPITEPGPYPTKLRFVNPGSIPLFVREDCQLRWELYSCADGYSKAVPHEADCMSSCAEAGMGCIACGACMMQAIEVTTASPLETDWSGSTFDFAQKNGCSCYNKSNAVPGKYGVRVPVFTSKEDAESFNAGYDAWGYFDLPAKNGVVEVTLVPTPEEG